MEFYAQTIPELVRELANSDPTLPLYRFLNDGESASEQLTPVDLHRDASDIASRLREKCQAGDRVLLLAPPGLDFVRGFFGIQYAGLIATTSYPPHPRRVDRTLHRLESIVASCQPKMALVTRSLVGVAEKLALPAIELDTIQAEPSRAYSLDKLDVDAPAFLQYTSGSTSQPRGVVLSHRNVLENLRFISQRFGHTRSSIGVIWLPPYHDMGLIGGILQPLYAGFPVVLLNPLHVLQRPVRWLNAITRYHATTSGGPNFAFDHCVDSINDEEKEHLDLSRWQVAFCGAETVRPETWRRFSDAFSECGFRKQAFFPCYGLAEATLMVTGSSCLTLPECFVVESPTANSKSTSIEYMSCGTPDESHELLVADQTTGQAIADGQIGEVWVSGDSVSQGYWNDAEATSIAFLREESSGKQWLKTGDLGFLRNGSLYITGRCKDLIILAGRNLYPQDLEASIERSHPLLNNNGACAFSIEGETSEQLIVIAEVRPGIRKLTPQEKSESTTAIRRVLSNQFDVQFSELWLVKAGSIPRTSSGKKKRIQTRELFVAKHFQHEDVALGDSGITNAARGIHRASLAARRLQQRLALIMVVVPMLGLIAAIVLAWGTGIFPVDLAWLIGLYLVTVFGVEVGFHRHFSHRAFQAVPAIRASLCILGSMAAQGPLVFWVATHRRHHAFSDQTEDPHSPVPTSPGFVGLLRGLWHAHVGWLFKSELTNPMQYGPDILRDPLTFRLNQYYPLWVFLGLLLPTLGNYAITGTLLGAARGFLWGGLVRILLVHHATWSVNSLCHAYGHREYETRDESRNNAWLVLSSLGGSWHNNHHAFPNSAFTGIKAWQVDPSGGVIRFLAWAGLVWDVKTPGRHERVTATRRQATALKHHDVG